MGLSSNEIEKKDISNDQNNESKNLRNFFVLTFIFSWTIFIMAPILSLGDIIFTSGLCLIGAYGPSLIAIILSLKNNKQKTKLEWTDNRIKIFAIIFTVSLIIGLLSFLPYFQVVPLILIGSLIAAYVFSGMYSSNKNVESLLRTLKGVKGNNIYLLVAIFIPLEYSLIGLIISSLFGGVLPADFSLSIFLIYVVIIFFQMFFFGGALNEEAGWRGFALPLLQKKYTPFISSLILGAFWALWHIPLHFNGFYPYAGIFGVISHMIQILLLSFIFTWYYNKSKGNLLGCVLLHASFNAFLNTILIIVPPPIYASFIINLMFFAIVLFLILRYKDMFISKIEEKL